MSKIKKMFAAVAVSVGVFGGIQSVQAGQVWVEGHYVTTNVTEYVTQSRLQTFPGNVTFDCWGNRFQGPPITRWVNVTVPVTRQVRRFVPGHFEWF